MTYIYIYPNKGPMNCATPWTSLNIQMVLPILWCVCVVPPFYAPCLVFCNAQIIKECWEIFFSLSCPQLISLVMVSIGVYARMMKHAGKGSFIDRACSLFSSLVGGVLRREYWVSRMVLLLLFFLLCLCFLSATRWGNSIKKPHSLKCFLLHFERN